MVKEEMYQEHIKGGKSPFQEEISADLFFHGGGRHSMLDELKDAIAGKVAVITLVGEEGDGKSHLCQMTLMDTVGEVFPVYLPDPLESYEDVIRIVAQEMNISLREQDELGGARNLLEEVLRRLDDEGKRLLLLFDQAEQIYLATLERIRKMVDHSNKERIRLQILLAGRSALKDSLQQLAMCSFEGVEEKHFSLTPLSAEDTFEYLNYCVQGGGEEAGKEVFSQEAAEKIYSIAHGNFRMTNILAEESLQSLTTDTSFLVLLDNVRDAEGEESPKKGYRIPTLASKQEVLQLFTHVKETVARTATELRKNMPVSYKDLLEQKEWVLGAGGGLVVVFILLFIIFGESEKVDLEQKIADSTNNKVEYKEVVKTPVQTPEVQKVPFVKEKDAFSANLEQQKNETGKVAAPEAEPNNDITDLVTEESEQIAPQEKKLENLNALFSKENLEEKPEEILRKEQAEPTVTAFSDLHETEPIQLPEKEIVEEPQEVPVQEKKEVAATIRVEPLESLPNQKTFPVFGGQGAVDKKIVIESAPDKTQVDVLYNRRVVASAQWWVGEQDGQYTVQLMALTSDKAEDNLKKMLMEKQYQEVVEDLYILRKKTTPLTVLVFFGEYNTMEEARKAKENLPEFLRKHQPYAISVAGAVKKAGSG